MIDGLLYLAHDYTTQVVVCGALLLGFTCGLMGSFAVLRQQSLMGDAISHATLPGVVVAYMLTGSKSAIVLLIGAFIFGWIAMLCVLGITRTTRIKYDAALGVILSVFFGLGLMLLTIVQRFPEGSKAGLNKFLFGSAATLLISDVWLIMILSVVTLLIVIALWKEFSLLVFDQGYAHSLGLPVRWLDIGLTMLIVSVIVIGLQTVGVVLMSAMIVAPAAAARQWSVSAKAMAINAGIIGALSAAIGVVISATVANLPTGPVIVIILSVVVLISLLFAPHRGIVFDFIRRSHHRNEIRLGTMLKNLLLFDEIPSDPFHPHSLQSLDAIGKGASKKIMNELKHRQLIEQLPDQRWKLTPKGLVEARRLTSMYEGDVDVH